MSIIGSNILAGAAGASGAATGYQIQRSLRFNSADSSHLSKTFSSAGNRRTWTWSAWVKRTKLATQEMIFQANNSGSLTSFYFNSADTALFLVGGGSIVFQTSRLFRDPTSWMHLVIAVDTTQSTAFDRIKFYVNGVKLTSDQYSTAPAPSLNTQYQFNNACAHYLSGTTYGHANSYMADVHFIDGQQLAPTNFGEFDDNNVWQPKEFAGQYAIAEALGSSSPTVFVGVPISALNESDVRYLNSNPDGSSYPIIHESSTGTESERTIRVKFHTPVSSVTSIKFRGGGYAAGQAYTLYVNGSQVGGTHTTASGWSEVEHTISSTDVSEIKIIGGGSSYGFALGQLKFNNSLVSGTPSYGTLAQGTNSFHLDFSDNSSNAALGTDSSGQNNTWTVNNLTASYGNGRYIGNVTGTPYSASYPAISAFDGNVASTYSQSVNGGNMTFTPSSPISVSSSLKVIAYTTGSSSTFTVNGTDYRSLFTTTGTQTITIPETSITSIVWGRSSNGSSSVQLQAIEVDGSYLIDYAASSNKDIDSLVDTPTNYGDDTGAGGEVRGCYATLNPLVIGPGTAPTISNGNLDVQANTTIFSRVVSTIYPTSGKWYAEVTKISGQTTDDSIGIGAITYQPAYSTNPYIGRTADSYGFYGNGRKLTNNNFISGYSTSWGQIGDVMGLLMDLDNGTLSLLINGVNQGVAFTGIDSSLGWTFAVAPYNNQKYSLNYGQRSWAFAPPSGYKALCTQNLPEPTIADGSAYMDVLTYTGDGSSSERTITGLSLASAPDLIWVKSRSNGWRHMLWDTVRGGSLNLSSNDTGQEYSLSNWGYGCITGNAADGIKVTRGNLAGYHVNENNYTYVAWTWDAGANSSKTYAVTVVSDSGNKYRFDGHGTSAVTLDLEEGSTYTFDQSDSSNAGHPLRFSTTSDGTHGSGSEYTTGVVTNGTPGSAGAYTKITIASGAPTLYYYCTQHSGMGGQINTNSTAGATVLSGSLNDDLYNQSQTWSSQVTGSFYASSYDQTEIFDGSLTTQAQSTGATWTTNVSFTTLRIYGKIFGAGSRSISVNGTDITSQMGANGAAAQWHTITGVSSPITSIQWDGGGYSGSTPDLIGIHGIEVDGKLLVDSGVSLAAVPSINSVVRANPTAGFSVVTWDASANATVAHGLNGAPQLVITKSRNNSTAWRIWSAEFSDADSNYLGFGSNAVSTFSGAYWGSMTSTTIGLSAASYDNNYGEMLAYCFAPVEGYSIISSWTGNGSADGPFVYTGMRIKWIMWKSSSNSGEHWHILDAERDPHNLASETLYANLTNAESTFDAAGIDILSNGFKVRGTNAGVNGNNYTYIFLAFAENPFRTARAR